MRILTSIILVILFGLATEESYELNHLYHNYINHLKLKHRFVVVTPFLCKNCDNIFNPIDAI